MRLEQRWLGRSLWRSGWALVVLALMTVGVGAPARAASAAGPTAPAGLAVVQADHDRVQLQWEGEFRRQYRIHWSVAGEPGTAGSTDASVIWAGPGLVRGSAFGLDLETTYVFHVVEVGPDGEESPPSNPVTATTLSVVPADVGVVSARTTSVNLAWNGIGDEWYRIDWHEADDPASTGSKTLSYSRRYPYPRPPGVNAIVSGLSPSTAYVFEIVHLDGGPDGEASAPSEPLVFATPPYAPPEVQARLDGNDVSLSWPKPADQLRQTQAHYDVFVDGVLETRVSTAADPAQVTLPRQTAGATHQYAVRHTGWIAPSITDPVAVAVPPAGDDAAPTAPGWEFTTGPPFDCGETSEYPLFRIVEPSTDDTSAPSRIRYEGLTRHPLTGELYVFDYDLGVTGPVAPERIRAVDEAGNRSPATAGTEVVPDC